MYRCLYVCMYLWMYVYVPSFKFRFSLFLLSGGLLKKFEVEKCMHSFAEAGCCSPIFTIEICRGAE